MQHNAGGNASAIKIDWHGKFEKRGKGHHSRFRPCFLSLKFSINSNKTNLDDSSLTGLRQGVELSTKLFKIALDGICRRD